MKSKLAVTQKKKFTANETESIGSCNRRDSEAESDQKENSTQIQTRLDIELVTIDNGIIETIKLGENFELKIHVLI